MPQLMPLYWVFSMFVILLTLLFMYMLYNNYNLMCLNSVDELMKMNAVWLW